MKNKINSLTFILSLFFLTSLTFAQSGFDAYGSFVKENAIQIKANNKVGKSVVVEVTRIEIPKNNTYKGFWGHYEEKNPKHVVSNISVKFDKKIIQVPLSAYMDLAEPSNVGILFSGFGDNYFTVLVTGGGCDSCGYKAVLTFKDDVLAERKVFSIDWENLWEETFYSLVSGATNN